MFVLRTESTGDDDESAVESHGWYCKALDRFSDVTGPDVRHE